MTLLIEHHEELELDLHAQHIDLLDVWRGRLSLRKLELFIRHLPPTSALVRALDPEVAAAAEWSAAEHLLADLFDLTAKAKFTNPHPHPRPTDAIAERQKKKAASDRRAALERQLERVKQRQAEGR